MSGRIIYKDYINPNIDLKYLENINIHELFTLKDLKNGTLLFGEKIFINIFLNNISIKLSNNEYNKLYDPQSDNASELDEFI